MTSSDTTATAVLDRANSLDTPPADPSVPEVYIDAITVAEMFVDTSYQRELDKPRARAMAKTWDRRLVGVLDVADRGRGSLARYAVINGQHRAEAARLINPDMALVANVHTGLTVADEARLFHEIDAKTRRLTTWDRWRSRRAAADPTVAAIEDIVAEVGLSVAEAAKDGAIRCTSTLERIHRTGGKLLLGNTLRLIVEVWGPRLDAVDAPLVAGVALILRSYEQQLDHDRFAEVLVDLAPRQVKARAMALKETEKGQNGALVALVMIGAYNSSRGPKLNRNELRR